MFFGQKELVIDEKNRLTLPSNYREEFMGGMCYAALGMDGCIELYPENVYQKKAGKIQELNDFDPKARAVKRTFISNTYDLQIDSHNRVLIPRNLALKTKVERKVVVVSMVDHLELWDAEIYAKRSENEEEQFSTFAQELIG